MTLPEITLVIGIDFKTVQQLEVSHRTWKKHQPKIFGWPWIVFYDGCCPAFTNHSLNDLVKRGVVPEQTRFVPWPQAVGGNSRRPSYASQREKMLSGHVYVPAMHVLTPWYCKLDCDALATRPAVWPQPDWFMPCAVEGIRCVVAAPRWGYTKGISYTDILDNWSDTVPILAAQPRLNIPHDPGQLRVGHPRWCSWNSFYRTEWAKECATMLAQTTSLEVGTLPVPSQDTFHWHCAERGREFVRKINVKAGFSNYPKLANLIETAQSIMRGEEQEAITDG